MIDEVALLNKRLKDVAEKFKALKECGINEDILISYLKDKTKFSRKNIKKMLYHTKEFFDKLVGDEILKKL